MRRSHSVDEELINELSVLTAEDIGDAENTTETRARRYGLIAAVLLGAYLYNARRGEWLRGNRVLDPVEALRQFASAQTDIYRALLRSFVNGRIDILQFQRAAGVELVRSHTIAGALGAGGFDALNPRTLQRLEQFIATEVEYLSGLFDRIAAGQSEALTAQHLRMYAEHTNSSFYEMRRVRLAQDGYTQERRKLNPAEHCADCLRLAGLGWQEIGTLPPPGQDSVCLGNCRCDMEFR